MHSHLLKIMLILGILMALCAGTSLSHFALNASAMSLHPTPGLSTGGAQPLMTTSQPLGSLASISWSELEIASSPPGFFQSLLLPPTAEPIPPTVGNTDYVTLTTDSPEESYLLPSETNPLETFHLSGDFHPSIGFACAACHVSPEAADMTTAAFGQGQSIQPADQSGMNIDCLACHIASLRHMSAHIRGVE